MATDLASTSVSSFPHVAQHQRQPHPSSTLMAPRFISPANAGAYLSALGISFTEDGDITTDQDLGRVSFSDVADVVEDPVASSAAATGHTWRFVAEADEDESEPAYDSDEADDRSTSYDDAYEPDDDGAASSGDEAEINGLYERDDDVDLSDEEPTETDSGALSYTATARYLCLVVVTDLQPEPGNPAAPAKEYVTSLEVKQDRPFTRHHIRLPHASIVVHLLWDDRKMQPQYQIRQSWQVPGHVHEFRIVHHNLVDRPCGGPCARRCASQFRSEVQHWVDRNFRSLDGDSDEDMWMD
ncbi:hypothetical protein AYL99_02817 [Fonsecaea erecta]|uniref:Uncharacterized protein n=1 Tax=Fonsecaea erecta TaxID=1367422 RepID=A0A178ZUZ5_9EURO|nr:hypothetical protein AYL99_02817 [Fonsecaea erecta]OAP63590.1 hypothetical protein AYL99_02817 [Fonsecaea erecta]